MMNRLVVIFDKIQKFDMKGFHGFYTSHLYIMHIGYRMYTVFTYF